MAGAVRWKSKSGFVVLPVAIAATVAVVAADDCTPPWYFRGKTTTS